MKKKCFTHSKNFNFHFDDFSGLEPVYKAQKTHLLCKKGTMGQ